MSAIELQLPDVGIPGRVVALLWNRTQSGETTAQNLVLELGRTSTHAVEPGLVLVRVKLPSGEMLTEEREVARGETASIVLSPARRGDWQHVLSPQRVVHGDVPETFSKGVFVQGVTVHAGKQTHELQIDGETSIGSATVVVTSTQSSISVRFDRYRGPRPLIELVCDDGTQVAGGPLPWLSADDRPYPVQLVLDRVHGPDVIVHDPDLSPILAYYASGDRGSARELSDLLEARAREAIMGKLDNPAPGAAGLLVLAALRPERVRREWYERFADVDAIADGAILCANHLMDSPHGRAKVDRIRALFLEARRRGLPVFARCGRMLRDGLERLQTIRDDPEVDEAARWARKLVAAQRRETLVTWLAGRHVHDLVPGLA